MYTAICPAAPGQPMGVLAYDSVEHRPERGSSYTEYFDRYTAYDPADGKVLGRAALGTRRDVALIECMAASGDHVWLRTAADGIHVRDARSGKVVKDQANVFTGITAPVDKAWFDADRTRLIVATKDGRNTEIAPDGATRAGPSAVSSLTSALAKTSAGVLSKQGVPRQVIFLGDRPLGDTDWLEPHFVIHPPSGTLEWPSPPSLIVCEPTEVRAPPRQITRVALDGTILWTYTPGAAPGRVNGSCTWYASGDGTRLVLLTAPNGMVGIDVATGREVFRRSQ